MYKAKAAVWVVALDARVIGADLESTRCICPTAIVKPMQWTGIMCYKPHSVLIIFMNSDTI